MGCAKHVNRLIVGRGRWVYKRNYGRYKAIYAWLFRHREISKNTALRVGIIIWPCSQVNEEILPRPPPDRAARAPT